MGNGLRFKGVSELPPALRAQVEARMAGAESGPLVINIPLRTPLLNDWQRMHWSKRSRVGREIVTAIALAAPRRPLAPIAKCRILIERFSTQEPDDDGLIGGQKPVLDALQPMSKRHPYGLGFIENDNRACVVDLKIVHVQGKEKRTRITITPVQP